NVMSKSQVALTGILALLLATVLLLAGCATTGTSSASQQADGLSSSYQIVTGTTDIPIYPGGEVTWNQIWEDGPGLGSFRVKTNASNDEIGAFYAHVLLARDWTLARDEGDEYDRRMTFIWTNSGDGAPARRTFWLSIDNVKQEGATIYAKVASWPDSSRVPLIEDAQNVETQWTNGLSRGFEDDRPLKVTTYTTASAPTEVEAFYKEKMPEHGWGLAVYVPHPGIAFSHSYLDPYGSDGEVWSNVVISSEQIDDARTQVVIEASASDLRQ
ncbi:MAG TPA: hypothetical protein VFR15_15600, partial [Chloroflexia bacterium]|nr:hypothetical protein [Chloroflexia bacterium]